MPRRSSFETPKIGSSDITRIRMDRRIFLSTLCTIFQLTLLNCNIYYQDPLSDQRLRRLVYSSASPSRMLTGQMMAPYFAKPLYLSGNCLWSQCKWRGDSGTLFHSNLTFYEEIRISLESSICSDDISPEGPSHWFNTAYEKYYVRDYG
ncbi:uncharacterized protein PV07_00480 [Cladophialophora immunda]|uniref:Uncharacterized protein n=1 Tax=Cladophialophora immunda TaxID=569365 RepID=A0A0D1ZZR3_9EURO|nr:uncharacterized protein PV07_00480 [Cladophialophora immunda]KIW33646.1 hypothetical protein PV07_00480 [Cladophialophora immunda]